MVSEITHTTSRRASNSNHLFALTRSAKKKEGDMKLFRWIFGASVLISFLGAAAPLRAQVCTPPPSDIVSWWPGEGNATDIIDTNPGALSGDAAFGQGFIGQAFGFSCGGGRVTVPDAQNLNFGSTSPMSVETWVFRTGSAGTQHILGKRVGCSSGDIHYQLAFDSVNGLAFNGSGGGALTGAQLPLFTWTHLAGTFDGTTFRLYINGTLAGTGTGTLGPANTAALVIGGAGGCEPFIGLIDEVSLYNRDLSASEIQAIFDAASAGKCPPG